MIGLQLLAALVHEGDVELFRKLQLTEKLFFGTEIPLFSYIHTHAYQYNVLPKPETVAEQLKGIPAVVEPVQYYADRVADRYVHKRLNAMLTECNDLMKVQDSWTAQAVVTETLTDLQSGPRSGHKPLGQYVLSAEELLKQDIPPIDVIVDPFLPSAALAMVYATRGVGKTWFSLQAALSVASGEDFFSWSVPKARPVLYVDGEMPMPVIQSRLFTLNPKPPANLTILSSEALWRDGSPLNLNLPEQQARIDQYLASLTKPEKPALIILDNLSALCAGIDENSNTDQDGLLRWLVKLRSQGFAVMLIHHSGKNGQQRGASRREDLLDTSIKLTETPPMHGDGAAFAVSFSKIRGKKPDPLVLTVELDTSAGIVGKWRMSADAPVEKWLYTLRLIRDEQPESQKALAELLSITEPAVSQHIKKARDKGYVHKGDLKLTESGMAELQKHWPKETVDALG